jgi:hypothetical protein
VITPDGERANDDGLGYYPDGVKRTLTDQQIEIFRHSEIQRLLRRRKLKREARLQQADDGSTEHCPHAMSAAKTACEEQQNGNPQHPVKTVQQGEIEHDGSGTAGRVMLVESNNDSANLPHDEDGVAILQSELRQSTLKSCRTNRPLVPYDDGNDPR